MFGEINERTDYNHDNKWNWILNNKNLDKNWLNNGLNNLNNFLSFLNKLILLFIYLNKYIYTIIKEIFYLILQQILHIDLKWKFILLHWGHNQSPFLTL